MKVLLGVAGDDRSMAAVRWVVDRSSADDEVTVALVDRPGRAVDRDEAAERIRRTLAGTGLSFDVRTLEGSPGSSLVALAEREGYDMLVVRGGETSPMGKVDLDRMEEYVLLNAQVSVTIVR